MYIEPVDTYQLPTQESIVTENEYWKTLATENIDDIIGFSPWGVIVTPTLCLLQCKQNGAVVWEYDHKRQFQRCMLSDDGTTVYGLFVGEKGKILFIDAMSGSVIKEICCGGMSMGTTLVGHLYSNLFLFACGGGYKYFWKDFDGNDVEHPTPTYFPYKWVGQGHYIARSLKNFTEFILCDARSNSELVDFTFSRGIKQSFSVIAPDCTVAVKSSYILMGNPKQCIIQIFKTSIDDADTKPALLLV